MNWGQNLALGVATPDALTAATADDWPAAAAAVRFIADHGGADGLLGAMAWWIDTAAQHAGGRPAGDEPLILVWLGPDGLSVDTDEVSPTDQWAGQLYASRIADDPEMWQALISALPDDGDEAGDYVLAVLAISAAVVRWHSQAAA